MAARKPRAFIWFVLFFLLFIPIGSKADEPLEKVTLALKWKHAFQFAGYYAAINQGFYKAEGLEVTLTEPENFVFPVASVVKGLAEYGISSGDLIRSRVEGSPIVVIGVIFQHSPIILLSRKDRGLMYLSDYVGKNLMVADGAGGWEEITAMFIKEGINPDLLKRTPHLWSVDPIISGKVDASVDYITDQPHQMLLKGVEPRAIKPIDYGIDFYADSIFTSEAELQNHPQRAKAFLRASIKGWRYALDHIDEMVKVILEMPGVKERGLTAEHLKFEATQMLELIQPKLVEIGHMNPARWKLMAETYARLGVIPADYSLEGFLYFPDDNTVQNRRNMRLLTFALCLAGLVLMLISLRNHKLKQQVRIQTEQLNESRRFTIQAVDYSRQLFGWLTPDGTLQFANKTSLEMVGKNPRDVIGKPFWECPWFSFTPQDKEKLKNSISLAARGSNISYEVVHLTVDGEPREIDFSLRPIFDQSGTLTMIVAEGNDITNEREAKRKESAMSELLHQTRKLEALGQLAGGIAHDFNNSLTGIIGAAELIKTSKSFPAELTDYVQMILKAAERAGNLTKKLLTFSRKGDKVSTAVNVAAIVNDAFSILRSTIDKNIEIAIEQSAVKTFVVGDDALLQNCLLNLGINASHAMSEGGLLTISLQNFTLDANYCAASPFDLKPGEYLDIGVRDTGSGMPPEIQSRIFEPFFSTKGQGKGTGLGLAAVYGTVREHGGAITVFSEVGKGSVFHIYLPVCESPDQTLTASDQPPTGTGTILLIDDEELIRITAESILKELGYTVLQASNGLQGLKIFADNPGRVDLVILDMIMPVMGGRETFAKLREISTTVPIIISSGFAKEEDILALKSQNISGFLQKPFRRLQLAEAVFKALQQNSKA
ncbi:MAG: ABC transporter substrate-binding protein [Candidatus Riflebacteria bacterium]|nr:ABC transporter substrate-binding protein [Candidatus Riflebacteria bacterium]